MEKLHAAGLARAIGVSNYRAEDIEQLSKSWTVPPAVNQVSPSVESGLDGAPLSGRVLLTSAFLFSPGQRRLSAP